MNVYEKYERVLGRKLNKHDILGLKNNHTLSKAFYKDVRENYLKYKQDLTNTIEKHQIIHNTRIEEEINSVEDEKNAIEEAMEEEKRKAKADERTEREKELGSMRFDEFEDLKQTAINLINTALAEHNEWEKKKVGPLHPKRKEWENSRPDLVTLDSCSLDMWKTIH